MTLQHIQGMHVPSGGNLNLTPNWKNNQDQTRPSASRHHGAENREPLVLFDCA